MARMPGADWVGPHHDNGTMSRWDIVCIHTIVGNPPAHAAHFSTRGDGWLYQSRDTLFASAANYNGNYRVIAIENDDAGPEFGSWNTSDPHQVPAFTAAQIETNAKVCAWAYQTYGIPLVQCPDSRPGSRGIAYHRQGIDGNFAAAGYAYPGRVSGGEVWTKTSGKACPGDRRIAQMPAIISRARQIAGLDPVEDNMAEGAEIKAMMWAGGNVPGSVAEDTLVARVRDLERMVWAGGPVIGSVDPGSLIGKVNSLETKLDQILELLQPPV